jgi:hypothetical protein
MFSASSLNFGKLRACIFEILFSDLVVFGEVMLNFGTLRACIFEIIFSDLVVVFGEVMLNHKFIIG